MIIASDFDDSIVSQAGRDYEDVETPLRFMPGAKKALLSLKRAGHTLLLYSGRANRALRVDPNLNPLVRAGVKRINREWWEANQPVNEARYQQMLRFVDEELPGVFDAVDDGQQGKPSADIYIDDKALRLGHGADSVGWQTVAHRYGEPVYNSDGGSDG